MIKVQCHGSQAAIPERSGKFDDLVQPIVRVLCIDVSPVIVVSRFIEYWQFLVSTAYISA